MNRSGYAQEEIASEMAYGHRLLAHWPLLKAASSPLKIASETLAGALGGRGGWLGHYYKEYNSLHKNTLELLMTFPSRDLPENLYFLTASLCGKPVLFSDSSYASIILDSLTWLRSNQRMSLYAFVLMPSHLHAIVKPINRSIGDLLQSFGSFTAHEILEKLRTDNNQAIINLFQSEHRSKQVEYSVWDDIQAKNIFSYKFLEQKIEYIHNNPVSKGWSLVKDRADFVYSSAGFYDSGLAPIISIDDIRTIL